MEAIKAKFPLANLPDLIAKVELKGKTIDTGSSTLQLTTLSTKTIPNIELAIGNHMLTMETQDISCL